MLNDIEESSELMEVADTFTFELGEEGDECLVETGIVACNNESVIVEADEITLKLLSENFILEDFEELDEQEIMTTENEEVEEKVEESVVEETDEIPEHFFNNSFCNVGKVKKDMKDFLDNPIVRRILKNK